MEFVIPEDVHLKYKKLLEANKKVSFNDWIEIAKSLADDRAADSLLRILTEMDEDLENISIERLTTRSRGLAASSTQEGTYFRSLRLIKKVPETKKFNEIISRLDKLKDWVKDKLKDTPLNEIFKELLEKARIKVKDDRSFQEKLEMLRIIDKKRSGQLFYKSINYNEFMAGVLTWALETNPELLSENKNLLERLMTAAFNTKNTENSPKPKVALKQIFNFYAKQAQFIGRFPTFEHIHHNSQVLEIGLFLRFCKDFEVIANSKKDRGVNRQTAQKVFAKNAKIQREMNFSGFSRALQELARLMEYTEEQLYKHLGCYDPAIYNEKMQRSTLPFQVISPSRITDDDLSKNYKNNSNRHKLLKEKIKKFRADRVNEQKTDVNMCITKFPKIPTKKLYSAHHNLLQGPFSWKSLTCIKPEHIISETDIKDIVGEEKETHLKNRREEFVDIIYK